MKRFLLLIAIAAGVLIGLDQFTNLSTIWKIGIPLAILFAGLLIAKLPRIEKTPTVGSTAPAAPTPDAAPADKATLRGSIIGILVALILITGLICGVIWLYRQFDDWVRAEATKSPTTVSVNPIGHDNIFIEDKSFKNWINPGIEYTIFELKKGWRWRWFMDKPIFWRVRSTGNERFAIADEGGAEFSANYDGVLEIKTDDNNNWVSITRRIYRQTRMNEKNE